MSGVIIYIDRSDIRPGRLDEVKDKVKQLSEFVKDNNPKIVDYRIFIDEELQRMTVIGIHPDSDALELHLEVGNDEFRKFAPLLTLRSIEVYGRPSGRVLAQLSEKAEMLGEKGTVTIQEEFAGFTRSG